MSVESKDSLDKNKMTTRADIERWLKAGKSSRATHMIVVCDTFSYEDYPVYVMPGENVKEKESEYNEKNMQRVMKIYSFSKDLKKQLKKNRNFDYSRERKTKYQWIKE